MALGLSPLGSNAVGASPATMLTTTSSSSISVPLGGLAATASVGVATSGVRGKATLTALTATAQMGKIGIRNNGSVTFYPDGFTLVGAVGEAIVSSRTVATAVGVEATGQLGSIGYTGPRAHELNGLEAIGQIGQVSADAPEQWTEVTPTSTPGWVDVVITMRVPTNN